MKLLTEQLKQRFAKVSSQEESADPIIICKFFNPTGRGTWYATEYHPKDKLFFGWVSLFGGSDDELGYFSLEELENFKGRFGLGIERDRFFSECKLSEVKGK